jgi:hypothetical protein
MASLTEATPGDNDMVDAVNLLMASLSGHQEAARVIVGHQPSGLEPLLADTIAMLVTVLRELPVERRDHYLSQFQIRAILDQRDSES